MVGPKLKILSLTEYRFIEKKDPEGIYDRDTRETLYWIIEKLRVGGRRCSRLEKKFFKKFESANFGILLPDVTASKGKIQHSGKISVYGRFEGEIQSEDTLLVEKSGILLANVSASEVICEGMIEGDIQAFNHVHICAGAQVCGDINTPAIKIEKGAFFEGRCIMPHNGKPLN